MHTERYLAVTQNVSSFHIIVYWNGKHRDIVYDSVNVTDDERVFLLFSISLSEEKEQRAMTNEHEWRRR